MAGPDGSPALHRPALGAAIRNLNPGYFALGSFLGRLRNPARRQADAVGAGVMGGQVEQC